MRMLAPALALAATLIPAAVMAQSSMSSEAGAHPAMATIACRKATDKDTSAMMTQNHEMTATTTDGTKLICMSISEMPAMMKKQETMASKAKDASAASEMWVDWGMKLLTIPF